MNNHQANLTASIPMYDLLDICCAAQAAVEHEKLADVLNRVFGYMTPEAKAEFNAWVDRKGWRAKETIILP
jgi:hypothetical protein